MNTNVAVNTDTNTEVSSEPKRSVGRPVDPSANIHKAQALYESLPEDQRKVKIATALFVDKLGLTPGSAQVYFYNIRKKLKEQA